MFLAATTNARAVTRTPHRCTHKPSPVLCAIHFHHHRANTLRGRSGRPLIGYLWIAESHPARRPRILTYWTRVHARALRQYAAWRASGRVPEPYRSNLLCIHGGEGAWNAYNPAGPYYGGLQMDAGFMRRWGAKMLAKYGGRDARYWSPHDQMVVGYHAAKKIGYGSWPNTGAACGL